MNNIPKENYKSLYFSLFESHLKYCLTVYGTASKCHTEKLFRIQKRCVRILFGNREEYLDKFKTCARVREFGQQILGPEFYCKENTKPIFTGQKILAMQNIYNYQACFEVLKILKISNRSETSTHVSRSTKLDTHPVTATKIDFFFGERIFDFPGHRI